MGEDDINALIARSMQRIKALKEDAESNEKLQAAKSLVKDMTEAYSETRKYEVARVDYLIGKLEEINGPFELGESIDE
jgi:vacuolar-type H+-ATPase subunit I/STV1